MNSDGRTANLKDTANTFAEYLSQRHWGPCDGPPPTLHGAQLPTAPIETGPFTVEELRAVLKKAQNNRSPGPDGIPVELLKFLTEEQLQALADLFTAVFETATPPEEWTIATVVDIFIR